MDNFIAISSLLAVTVQEALLNRGILSNEATMKSGLKPLNGQYGSQQRLLRAW